MHENFDMILNRDKNLNKISQMSSDLKDNSKKVSFFYKYKFYSSVKMQKNLN